MNAKRFYHLKQGPLPQNKYDNALVDVNPCFPQVDRSLRIRQNVFALSIDRKEPDIFCCTCGSLPQMFSY
jgi:hypothetical protein